MTGKYLADPRKILSQGDKESWLKLLRSDQPLTGSTREHLASILEEYFKAEDQLKGPRKISTFEKNRELIALVYLSNLVSAERQFAGKSYDQAVREVANRENIKYKSFKKDLGALHNLSRPREPVSPDEQEANEWLHQNYEKFSRMIWKQWRAETTRRR